MCYWRGSDALLCLQDATCLHVGGYHCRWYRHYHHQGLPLPALNLFIFFSKCVVMTKMSQVLVLSRSKAELARTDMREVNEVFSVACCACGEMLQQRFPWLLVTLASCFLLSNFMTVCVSNKLVGNVTHGATVCWAKISPTSIIFLFYQPIMYIRFFRLTFVSVKCQN